MGVDLGEVKTEKLMEELEKRRKSLKDTSKNNVIVLGSFMKSHGENYIEIFRRIDSEKDLEFLPAYEIRMRFNSHRDYRLFYFKTDCFELLEQNFKENNNAFANKLLEMKSVKYL